MKQPFLFRLNSAENFRKESKKRFDELGVDSRTITIDVQGRLKPGRKMNCYW